MSSKISENTLSPQEMARYGRHLALPEVGIEGQRKLKAARVLIVGAGGLGSPASLYLAAAGVGTLGLVEDDTIDASNLQRQILYSTEAVGSPKLTQARRRLLDLNPYINIETHPLRLTAENALEIVGDYDIVIDATDNFSSRYLISDACVLSGKPEVYGAIFRFDGQVAVFSADRGPCYRCLFPEPPASGALDCSAAGVLGVLPGVIGTLQAVETIKLILGVGKPLIGRLMLYDALQAEWRSLSVRKDPACALCGPTPTIKKLLNYGLPSPCPLPLGERMKVRGQGGITMFGTQVPEVTVEELKTKIDRKEDIYILDVREKSEYEFARISGTHLIPLGELPDRLGELEPFKKKEIVVHCRSGARSAKAVKFLRDKGFQTAVNLAGGILAWSEKIDPSIPQY